MRTWGRLTPSFIVAVGCGTAPATPPPPSFGAAGRRPERTLHRGRDHGWGWPLRTRSHGGGGALEGRLDAMPASGCGGPRSTGVLAWSIRREGQDRDVRTHVAGLRVPDLHAPGGFRVAAGVDRQHPRPRLRRGGPASQDGHLVGARSAPERGMMSAGGCENARAETIRELVADAKRLGANALVDWQMRDGAAERMLTAKAVTITVDPSSCKEGRFHSPVRIFSGFVRALGPHGSTSATSISRRAYRTSTATGCPTTGPSRR